MRGAIPTIAVIVVAFLFLVPFVPEHPGVSGLLSPSGTVGHSRAAVDHSASGCSTPLQSTNPVVVDQAELPDSLDPAVTFSTPGWGAVQQVYQGLVQYNGTSYTDFTGVLAKNWSVAYNPLTGFESYTFHLRSGVHFSNGDPYNAYVQWYSLYRSLLLAQGPQFILEQNFYSTNFSTSAPLSYYSPQIDDDAANTTLATDLNSWNFFAPTSGEIASMSEPYQSFQVVDPLTIQLNLGYGYLDSNYTYLLASLSAPGSYAVDPAWVGAHGGVQPYQINNYLTTNTLGTGQYLLQSYNAVEDGGYTLVPDPQYWGNATAQAEPWNTMLQPANTSIKIVFQGTTDVEISDLENGLAASASFGLMTPSTITDLQSDPCLSVQALPSIYGATTGSHWVYLNQSVYPFNNLSVRAAIAHAIDYNTIIAQAFGGYAQQWVGPVPPGYPYYDPANLPPYSYNLSLADQEIANSPCASDACRGTPVNFEYLDTNPSFAMMAVFVQNNLAAIGLTVNPIPISLPDLYVEQTRMANGVCTSSAAVNGGPFYMGQEFYTSDYVAPDDWTQNDAYSFGSANGCMAGYDNATVDSLVYQAAADSNPVNLTTDYSTITSAMYYNYTDIWLAVPTAFSVSSVFLHGVITNPMASAEPFAMLFNTQWARNPPALAQYPVTFTENGLPAGTNWSVSLSGTSHWSTTSSIGFSERIGHYSFDVGSVPSYAARPLTGNISVNGSGATQWINFTATTGGGGSSFLGLPGIEGYVLIVGVLVVAAAVVVVLVRSRGGGPSVPGPPPSSGPPAPPPGAA